MQSALNRGAAQSRGASSPVLCSSAKLHRKGQHASRRKASHRGPTVHVSSNGRVNGGSNIAAHQGGAPFPPQRVSHRIADRTSTNLHRGAQEAHRRGSEPHPLLCRAADVSSARHQGVQDATALHPRCEVRPPSALAHRALRTVRQPTEKRRLLVDAAAQMRRPKLEVSPVIPVLRPSVQADLFSSQCVCPS